VSNSKVLAGVLILLLIWSAALVLMTSFFTRLGVVGSVIETETLIVGGTSKHPAKIMLTVLPDGNPKILMYDAAGKSILDIWGINASGTGAITLNGKDGKPAAVLEIVPTSGKPRLKITDPQSGQTTLFPTPAADPG
jgi:hypothetical protein